jgi:phenylpropionate dioxygenase-like ring-hydroxylating dioxygenase large terminal subunit
MSRGWRQQHAHTECSWVQPTSGLTNSSPKQSRVLRYVPIPLRHIISTKPWQWSRCRWKKRQSWRALIWNVLPCNSVVRPSSRSKTKPLFAASFLMLPSLDPDTGGSASSETSVNSELQIVTSQKSVLYAVTTMRTSDPTKGKNGSCRVSSGA